MARKRRNQKRKPQRKHKATQENTTKEGLETEQGEFVWTVERKIELMNCMIRRKPAGLHKHISMLLIKINLSERLKMNVPIKEIWSYLNIHWDMDKADEIEDYQIKNIEKKDFELPQTEEWISLIKEQEALIKSKDAMKQTNQAAISNVDLKTLKSVKIMVEKLDYNSEEAVKSHLINFSGQYERSIPPQQMKKNEDIQLYICSHCSRVFQRRVTLKKHLESHSEKPSSSLESEEDNEVEGAPLVTEHANEDKDKPEEQSIH